MSNFIRFNDFVSLDLLNPELIKIQDNLGTLFSPQTNGPNTGLFAVIAASHSGLVTRNNGFYLPDRMKTGTNSFLNEYPKPILLHHDGGNDPVGRAAGAEYVDTSGVTIDQFKLSEGLPVVSKDGKLVGTVNQALIEDFVSGKMPFSLAVDTVRKLLTPSLLDNAGYAGLGFLKLTAHITDEAAVKKLLDGRYLTGSVGLTTNQAICSICRQDLTENGFCEHRPGAVYDGQKCFLIMGDLMYEEYSFVNTPADRYSRVLELHFNGVKDSIEIVNQQTSRPYEVSLQFPQFATEGKMTVVQDHVAETLESLNDFLNRVLPATEISVEDYSKLNDMLLSEILFSDALVQTEEDWEKISLQMEEFALALDGEDQELACKKTEENSECECSQCKPETDVEDAEAGGSNAGKYKTKGPYCGPSGGAPKGTYPVNTLKRAKAALAYARHAPKPEGIRNCVCKHYPDLPSCKKKDSLLSVDQLHELSPSQFAGPNRMFPVVNVDYYKAIISLLDKYTGTVDVTEIRQTVERKAQAKGFVQVEEVSPLKLVTEGLQKIKETGISKEDLLVVVHQLSSLVDKAQFIDVLVEEKLITKSNPEKALLDEIANYEMQVVDLKATVKTLTKEHVEISNDSELLQDELLKLKALLHVTLNDHLVLLKKLNGTYNSSVTYDTCSDTEILKVINETKPSVDIEKIIAKLGDGTARNPSGIVDDPTMIQDSQVQHLSVEDAVKIEERYLYLLWNQGAAVAKAYIDKMKETGKLPIKSE